MTEEIRDNELYKNLHFKPLANNLSKKLGFDLEYSKWSNKIKIEQSEEHYLYVRDWEDAYNYLGNYIPKCQNNA